MADQIDVYVLENGSIEDKLLYACRIAAKAYEQKLKVFFRTDNPQMDSRIDALLWTFSVNSFIPHCVIDQNQESWDDYPVQMGKRHSAGMKADVLINLADSVDPAVFDFPRIVDLVSADPADRENGRQRYRKYREQGNKPNTHKL